MTAAGLIAGQCGATPHAGRFVIVVDADVDIYDLNDVVWAMFTRSNPVRDVRTIDRAWSGPLDAAIHPDERGYNSRLIVDATTALGVARRFAEPVVTPEMARRTRDRWGWILRNA